MPGIERLSANLRNMARLNREEARMMHVINERQLYQPGPLKRYNVRTKDGVIQKYTLGDDFIVIEYLKKVKNKYVTTFKNFISDICTFE